MCFKKNMKNLQTLLSLSCICSFRKNSCLACCETEASANVLFLHIDESVSCWHFFLALTSWAWKCQRHKGLCFLCNCRFIRTKHDVLHRNIVALFAENKSRKKQGLKYALWFVPKYANWNWSILCWFWKSQTDFSPSCQYWSLSFGQALISYFCLISFQKALLF